MFVKMQAFGRVKGEPELVVTKDGTPFAEFPLAVNTKRCVEDITVWLTCQAWGDMAETIKQSVTKGAMLFVQGHFTPYQYALEGGQQEVRHEVTLEKFSFDGDAHTENTVESIPVSDIQITSMI